MASNKKVTKVQADIRDCIVTRSRSVNDIDTESATTLTLASNMAANTKNDDDLSLSSIRELLVNFHNETVKKDIKDAVENSVKPVMEKLKEIETLIEDVDSVRKDVQDLKSSCEFNAGEIKDVAGQDGTGVIYFRGENSILSNFYQCRLEHGEKVFCSAEQMYQMEKALYHNCHDLISKLMSTSPAHEVKAISNCIATVPSWYYEKTRVMEKVLNIKLKQCQEFSEFLKLSKGKKLIHDDPNSFWGTGIDVKGKNMMGKILEKIRDDKF